ncbi:hypothetical protein Cni_G24176 [Canna indica]|uniref:Epidermal patterning factor-like protein n=1 Tax=Canna indica TaxID=4628 RepID=A0AAQ3KVP7_9LILI|nr:hypothetical protein Cni_G24176 [Canna indica]
MGTRSMDEEEEKVLAKPLMGSRPPRCEMRCNSCVHCEPVQVPVVPLTGIKFWRASTSGVDYSSNYKPMSWKCKCGDMFFDP